ncbi:MAG TPA: hypothetical protein ENK82_03670 [Campylobacterales bacterium]|nr:hypothetical protein [Campylobacterales bacterium]
MERFRDYEEEGLSLIQKVLIFIFVAFYPMVVSMYTMLPPLIGIVAYFLILSIEKEEMYIFAPLIYLINLDLNLSLPLFLSIVITVLIYLFVYMPLKRLIRCKVCLLFALIFIIDVSYYLSLFVYDFIFQTSTVLADMLLIYYIAVDILIGMLV